MHVPVNEPIITEDAKRYIAEAMESGWVSSGGPFIERFEQEFAKYLGVKHAVTTTSGTTALHLALVTLGIGPGDEVILPDFTMMACVFAVLYTGAKPVFVDVDPDIFTMDPEKIEEKITQKTKVIMPVHIYGHPVDMDPVIAIAERHDLWVMEDAAEAHGARYKGRLCGSIGDINAFSFYGNKIITTGEGGMVVTNDDALATHARTLRNLAHSPEKRFWHKELGFNYRMTNLQAALGCGQLAHIEEFIAKKEWMAAQYASQLHGVRGLRLPVTKEWATNVHWMYAVLVEDAFPLSRDAFREALLAHGIDTRDFFTSCSSQPATRKYCGEGGRYPVTERIADHGLYLPSGLALSQEQLDTVCHAIRAIAHVG
ncbi:aminotransferase DegT [Candidatus Peribacteria bacterium RIFCSPLOWO2_12_FULL_55_15]|nr:MAG: aminotransferase DegT [Candidatus Peribacteria bacterium RIFCSPHIGHO2_01_FULL_54_22]OGJ62852.1 MAG: aminotransferase DegT [Candidatus Peribacteria bacterium RIFCSPHIGHO2_02_FULL_55_24]OGJ63901.1 MAG: aminotransferase DegT [Candidatus Peribacteria bacterium RIFCSPHIGHO2_12_FULL_54_10]OGJ67115.1 MAG: aminotransferase DegT [Candidatus Peribacteria bacterium RIFCSPLOWO2_01_FULL_54_110]OGJ69185.1 MAG: aminotransferase DegT [Candidatus Peribacteria bacterium RIFCSPLOWO2_02_FULL_55_36]OGJ7048